VARVTSARIVNYRSIRGPLHITFPERAPLVLIGENNAGKSNIIRAFELPLGETWPGSHDPDDHEFYGRDATGDPIDIRIDLQDVPAVVRGEERDVLALRLQCPCPADEEHALTMVLDRGESRGYVSNDIRLRCLCVVVGADRRLSWVFSYSSKWTLLSKLMRQFHKSLTTNQAAVDALKRKFEEITEIFSTVTEFATFERELARQVDELSGNLSYGLAIDFSAYDPSNFFHALRVTPTEGGQPRTFDELGTGQEQVLAIAFAQAYARAFHGQGRSLLLVIEEPEAHLHPLAQEWLARKLRELARVEGIQVVLTTHSPAFAHVGDLPGLVVVRKGEDGTITKQLTFEELAAVCGELGATRATTETVGSFYEAAATPEILAGLFARVVVLVEGPTEAAALPVYLRKVGLDPVRNGIAVISVGGVGNLAKWVRFFTAYQTPTYVVFDNDRSDDGEGVKREDLMSSMRIDSDTGERLVNAVSFEIQSAVCACGVNFEESLVALFGERYADLENEGRERFGLAGVQSKPLLARFVADRLSIEEGTGPHSVFQALANAITARAANGREESGR